MLAFLGSVNGFFVLDIDFKDNGYEEFKKD